MPKFPPNPTDPLASEFYATCGAGLERILALELESLGCERVQSAGAGVRFYGSLSIGYTACLWSRVANRVLLPIHRGKASNPEELYALVQEVDWSSHLESEGTLAVDFYTANSAITHSRYGALKVKDAVVDQFRDCTGRRPDVDRDQPDVRINVYLFRNNARIAIDLSGSSLHRRGYRVSGGLAPVKENLAAAVLLASGWPQHLRSGKSLFDPLCGSGTLLIEAAMIARDQAPGLHRQYFGFLGWKQHDATLWDQLVGEAESRITPAKAMIVGADKDAAAIENCRLNILQANLSGEVEVMQWDLEKGRPEILNTSDYGLLVTNPPYGERLRTDNSFYKSLGWSLSRYFAGWHCALFTAESTPHRQTMLPLRNTLQARNGGIDCVLLCADIPDSATLKQAVDTDSTGGLAIAEPLVDATPVINRLKKNLRTLKNWVKQNDIRAYRVYDADIPEFAVAIDLYEAEKMHCVVQEYQAPSTVNVAVAQARFAALIAILPETLGIAAERIHLKIREVQSGRGQYEKLSIDTTVVDYVTECSASIEINFTDYLDVGLFLDHRPVRKFIAQNAKGKRFLNLFSYTATATLAAVTGGALESVSVDSSNRYCQWARRNLDRNGAAAQHHVVVRQDVMKWLESAELSLRTGQQFDMILLDPPTYSNSTDIERDWNIQRDYLSCIHACLNILTQGGLLIFSTNFRKFKFDKQSLMDSSRGIRVEERTRWSIDRDFQRNQRIHQCWFIYK